jgi:hypothetical protein
MTVPWTPVEIAYVVEAPSLQHKGHSVDTVQGRSM